MQTRGVLFALSAFVTWGLFPFYFKAVAHIPALEVLSNRVIWGAISLLIVLTILKFKHPILSALRSPKQAGLLITSAFLISINWGVYIWSVEQGQLFQASLGYYINPLVSIALSFCILKERLNAIQWLAVALASIGVGIQIFRYGDIPYIALMLALSFGFYSLIHKTISVEPISSLWIETLLLFPIAMGYLLVISLNSNTHLIADTTNIGPLAWTNQEWLLLMLAGPVTIIPLLLYSSALKYLRLSIVSIMQYIVPTILFCLAAFYYKEPFDHSMLITFGFIWVALAIISIEPLKSISRRT